MWRWGGDQKSLAVAKEPGRGALCRIPDKTYFDTTTLIALNNPARAWRQRASDQYVLSQT
jgi:hypothetical protein